MLEELCVRSNLALTQKKVNNDISCGDLMGDDFGEEYRTMCAQVVGLPMLMCFFCEPCSLLTQCLLTPTTLQDKVTLKLFATTVEAGKLERGLDLVDRLHLEKSYDLAMAIAENHTKLVDFIEEAKESRFPLEDVDDVDEEEQEEDYDDDEATKGLEDVNSSPPGSKLAATRRISPDSSSAWKSSKRSFGGQQDRNVRARAF